MTWSGHSVQLTELAWRNTAGNPLAVEELLYHLIDGGQLGPARCGMAADTRTGAGTATPSMLQLIGSRIGRMTDSARRLVVTAAVYGEQFPLAATQAALGVGEADSMQAIHDATAARHRVS